MTQDALAHDPHDPAPPKTRHDLEWDRVLGALAERCAGPLGRDLARSLPFPTTHAAARAALEEAREATRLADDGEPLPMAETPDVREALDRARAQGVLGPAELRGVARLLGHARGLRRYLQARKARAPGLHDACATDPGLDELADAIERCFDPDGSLADHASPRLRELREEWRAARARMVSRLEDFMQRYEGILQDRFVTERDGRWVVPVRSDAHERFPGIVHATSASGATLFVEPRAVVPLGNRLKVLEAEVQREENAVYARLTSLLGESLPSVLGACEAIARADVRAATAKLAVDIRLRYPEVTDEPRLELVAARHPLLALDLPDVVPSDLALEAGRGVVVSGPNAGGKTVALKTLGLVALMVRAGLPVPCNDGTVVGLFDRVLTDVGDDQSLQKSLSTFSAHVQNLTAILDEATRGTLVLLDELAGGTDPREGEALAAGVLDALAARGAAVAVTTHYEGLKALALGDARFRNASCGFDLATMTPTFRLVLDVPGSSSALAVARRFGMPSLVVARAEKFLSREDHSFETLVKELADQRAALELARGAAEEREREAAAAKRRLEEEIAAMKDREKRLLSRESEDLLARVRRAKDELATARAKLRGGKPDPAAVKEAGRVLDRVAAQVALGGELEPQRSASAEPEHEPLAAGALRKGARVYVPRLRALADVVELLDGGAVRVAAGPLKLTVAAADLRAPSPGAGKAPERAARGDLRAARGSAPAAPASFETSPMQTTDNSCDLRGLRADDAIPMALSFLDRALQQGQRAVWLVHGHGSGALREAVRRELAGSPYVAHFRGGDPGEGGDGVTIAWLA